MITITAIPSATAPTLRRTTLHAAARVRRVLNHWVAAANAYRERQARLSAPQRPEGRKLDKTRIYRGPIDQAVERAAQFRKRRSRG